MKKNVMEKYQEFLSTLDDTQASNDGCGTERENAEDVFREYHKFTGEYIEYCCKDYEIFMTNDNTKYMTVHFYFCPFCGGER